MSDNSEFIRQTRLTLAKLLRDIPNLYLELHWEARAKHSDRLFPGGRPLDLMGPASAPSRWESVFDQYEAANDVNDSKWKSLNYADDNLAEDESHPLYVTTSWVEVIREERNQPTDLTPTISRNVDYLASSIDWMLRTDEYGDMEWLAVDHIIDDLEAVKRAMENVLIQGLRAERTRVRCTKDKCQSKLRLIKMFGAQARWDEYKCPDCGARYTPKEFEDARSTNYRATGTMEKFVPVHLAKTSIKADRRTFWSWMDRLKTRAACDIKTRQVIVWWPAVFELDKERQRRSLEAKLKKKRRSA